MTSDDEYIKYRRLKTLGFSAEEIASVAHDEGISPLDCVRILVKVYGLDLMEAKKISLQALGKTDQLNKYINDFLDEYEKLDSDDFD